MRVYIVEETIGLYPLSAPNEVSYQATLGVYDSQEKAIDSTDRPDDEWVDVSEGFIFDSPNASVLLSRGKYGTHDLWISGVDVL